MKIKNYKIEEKTCASYEPVRLGVQGESEAREIHFDLSEWLELYGPGTAVLSHKRAKDTTATLVENTYMDGSNLVWVVGTYDTASAGVGTATITYEPDEGGTVKVDVPTMILPSQLGSSASGGLPAEDCEIDTEDLYDALKEVYGDEFIDSHRRY